MGNGNAFLKCIYRFCLVKPAIFFKSSNNTSVLFKHAVPRQRQDFPLFRLTAVLK